MILKRVELTGFKNYAHQTAELAPRLNCFVGPNGAGKTNFLDALYYLCMCKSYFAVPDKSIILKENAFMRLDAVFDNDGKKDKVVAKLAKGRKKVIERNRKAYQKFSEHIGQFPVVMIAPDDTALIREGSEGRRKFIDNTLAQLDVEYLRKLILYNKVLQQRNALLKHDGKAGTFSTALLDVYDRQLLDPAGYIHGKRQNFLREIGPVFQFFYQEIAGAGEEVGIEYASQLEEMPLHHLLLRAREKDRILQRTTAGIHRDDLVFTLYGDPVKRFGSQGQVKSFLLALKLAQYECIRQQKKSKPLLLLDDIFDKLDANRVSKLLAVLEAGPFGQVLITDTHEDRIRKATAVFKDNYKLFYVNNGQLSEGAVAGKSE